MNVQTARWVKLNASGHERKGATAVFAREQPEIRIAFAQDANGDLSGCRDLHMRSCRPNSRRHHLTMTETMPTRPFDDGEAIA